MQKIFPDQIVVFWGKSKGTRSLSNVVTLETNSRCVITAIIASWRKHVVSRLISIDKCECTSCPKKN